jgi:hypothetical protein
MMTMTMLIRSPTHQIEVINLFHYKMEMTMILTYKVQIGQTANPLQMSL